jgi:adenine phosphoribosyltransferase
MNFKEKIRVIPDFPQPGIRFKDITTLLKDGAAYRAAIDELVNRLKDKQIDLVVGPEARGFVVGAPLAVALGVGFVPVRKAGKLPAETVQTSYSLEYGKDTLAMHKDAIQPGQKVLIADDLLATGGAAFFIELTYLNGRDKLKDLDIITLVQY